MQNENKKGFTLVEIMTVVIIIGLLATLAIPVFNTIFNRILEKMIVNDGRLIGAAIQQVAVDSGNLFCDVTFTPGEPMTWTVSSTSGDIYPGSLSRGVNGTTVTGLNVNNGTFILTHLRYKNANTSYTNAKSGTDSLSFTAEGAPTP